MTDWDAVVTQHVALVRSTIYRLVGNDADTWDCVQETFLEAVKLERREGVRDWPALLHRLATTCALDLLRKRCRLKRIASTKDPVEANSHEPGPPGWAEASELADRLRAALGRLPRRQAEVFCLTCFEDLSSQEIAQRLRISPTATRMLLSRARRRLERLLAPFVGVAEKNERTHDGKP
jgi:RNA polymerase sigma-70 factor (ECF subfamily)